MQPADGGPVRGRHSATTGGILPLSLLLLLTLFFFGPLTIHMTNLDSFAVPSVFHALSGAVLVAALAPLLWLSGRLLPTRAREKIGALFLAAAIGLWIQGSILVWRYGPMDGRPIDWGAHWGYGLVDASVWAVLLIGAWIRSDRVARGMRTAVLWLLVVQIVSLTSIAVGKAGRISAGRMSVAEDGLLDLSKGRNVVLLVFDELQGDLFPAVCSRNPEVAEALDGFVRYPDTLAGASFTEIAVPFLMTGELYDNSVPRDRFLEEAFSRHAVSKVLLSAGIDARVYPWQVLANDALFIGPGIAANFRRFSISGGYREEAREYLLLLQVSLFRQLPHLLKRHLYDQGEWGWRGFSGEAAPKLRTVAYTDNNRLMTTLAEQTRAAGEEPAFRFYHFAGAHIPLHDYDHDGGVVPYDRENYLTVYAWLLRRVGEYVSRLQSIGVYDDTMLLVLGDHGSGRSPDLRLSEAGGEGGETGTPDFPLWKARGMPLLLVKPFGSRGPLRVSAAPASLGDIPKTVAAAMGVERDLPGEDLLRLSDAAFRTRRYAAFSWSPKRSDYLSPITLFAVSGPVWEDRSWRRETVLPPKGVGATPSGGSP